MSLRVIVFEYNKITKINAEKSLNLVQKLNHIKVKIAIIC